MTQAVNEFYTNDYSFYDDIKIVDNAIDFSQGPVWTSKSGIKKNLEEDAIEIILDLVKMGKVDPWDIDIVDLYDKYIERIKQLKHDNLRSVGKAILFSSTLLKIKSDILQGISVNDFELSPEDMFNPEEDEPEYEQMQISSNNVISFDEALQRRTSIRLNRKRTVTLDDLMRHIKFYEDLQKKYEIAEVLKRTQRRVRNYSRLDAQDIKDIAHEEYIEEAVEKMRQNLRQILKREEKIELKELTLLGFNRSVAFIALLFLLREGEFDIFQEEFYGKVFATKAGEK